MLMLLIALPITVYSEDVENTDSVEIDESEMKYFGNVNSAQMRLYQLANVIEIKRRNAENILMELEMMGESASTDMNIDVERLYEIFTELEALSMQAEDMARSEDINEMLSSFYLIKDEAKTLTSEFRSTISPLDEDMKDRMKKRFEKRNEILKNRGDRRANEMKKKYNMEILKIVAESTSVDFDSLISQYESGDITIGEVTSTVRSEFSSLTPEEKREINMKIKEFNMEKKVGAQNNREELRKNIENKRQEFIREREMFREMMSDRIEERKKEFRNMARDFRGPQASASANPETN